MNKYVVSLLLTFAPYILAVGYVALEDISKCDGPEDLWGRLKEHWRQGF